MAIYLQLSINLIRGSPEIEDTRSHTIFNYKILKKHENNYQ
jgi:hypothetical protein